MAPPESQYAPNLEKFTDELLEPWPHHRHWPPIYTEHMAAAVLVGQTARGHPKAFPRPRQPLFAVPALRELESACGVGIL